METIEIKSYVPYKAYIGIDILKELPDLLKRSMGKETSEKSLVFIVTDKNVARYYLKRVSRLLKKSGFNVKNAVLRPGERLKSFNNIINLINFMIKKGLARDSIVIGLGGGVIGDFSGFAASIYMRGCGFIQIPTSLLAQVDSSIGGKVGINLKEGKNLVGSFYNPLFVLTDIELLKTLNAREFVAGFSEIIKYGLIFDRNLFDKLNDFFKKNVSDEKEIIDSADVKSLLLSDSQFLHYIITRSIKTKGDIVSQDEREKDLRMILNFGHTFGHAIETLTGYKRFIHGEAVLLGMKIATELSYLNQMIDEKEKTSIITFLNRFIIPSIKVLKAKNIFKKIEKDKKKKAGNINYVLLKEIGYAITESNIEKGKVLKSIENVIA